MAVIGKQIIFWIALVFLANSANQISYASPPIWQQIKQPSGSTELTARVFASVGDYLYDVKGLTSPGAQVKLISSQNTIRVTTFADKNGVFRFYHLLSPRHPGMFCFFNRDRQGRSSPPLCLWPPTPGRQQQLEGILLPPTFSLIKPQVPGQPLKLTGLAIPQSQARVFTFQSLPFWRRWLKFALAQQQDYSFRAAADGSFQTEIGAAGHGRVLVGLAYKKTAAPPSYNLHWQSLTWGRWVWQQLIGLANQLIGLLCHYLWRWATFFAVQVSLIIFIFWRLKNDQPAKK